MRVALRETGSIRVSATKEEVLDVLARSVRGSAVRGDRVEADGSAYVVRASPDGAVVFHARSERAPVTTATRDRETLRLAVQADLHELARVIELGSRS